MLAFRGPLQRSLLRGTLPHLSCPESSPKQRASHRTQQLSSTKMIAAIKSIDDTIISAVDAASETKISGFEGVQEGALALQECAKT